MFDFKLPKFDLPKLPKIDLDFGGPKFDFDHNFPKFDFDFDFPKFDFDLPKVPIIDLPKLPLPELPKIPIVSEFVEDFPLERLPEVIPTPGELLEIGAEAISDAASGVVEGVGQLANFEFEEGFETLQETITDLALTPAETVLTLLAPLALPEEGEAPVYVPPAGTLTLNLSQLEEAAVIDLETGENNINADVSDILNIQATEFNDRIDGNEEANILLGAGGDDKLDGRGGDDTLGGGDGNDTLFGGAGDDKLAGEAGDDFLQGGMGSDVIDGGLGFDTMKLSGSINEYAIYQQVNEENEEVYFVDGTDGLDVLAGIEALEFDDGTISPEDFFNGLQPTEIDFGHIAPEESSDGNQPGSTYEHGVKVALDPAWGNGFPVDYVPPATLDRAFTNDQNYLAAVGETVTLELVQDVGSPTVGNFVALIGMTTVESKITAINGIHMEPGWATWVDGVGLVTLNDDKTVDVTVEYENPVDFTYTAELTVNPMVGEGYVTNIDKTVSESSDYQIDTIDQEFVADDDTDGLSSEEVNQISDTQNVTDYVTGTAGNDAFVIQGNSTDFGWGKTEDNQGIVVWSDDGHDILYDVEQLTFDDTTVELDYFA